MEGWCWQCVEGLAGPAEGLGRGKWRWAGSEKICVVSPRNVAWKNETT